MHINPRPPQKRRGYELPTENQTALPFNISFDLSLINIAHRMLPTSRLPVLMTNSDHQNLKNLEDETSSTSIHPMRLLSQEMASMKIGLARGGNKALAGLLFNSYLVR